MFDTDASGKTMEPSQRTKEQNDVGEHVDAMESITGDAVTPLAKDSVVATNLSSEPTSKPALIDTSKTAAPAVHAAPPDATTFDAMKPERKHGITWDRTIEVLKVVVTLWAALLGSYVTMQYNQRQNELSRIEAIAQMLPHISGNSTDPSKSSSSPSDDMSRDGAFWAIFRAANDKNMLRDLAALFPMDIYRVVSSIVIAGELDHDPEAVVALQVSSEKLAVQYSANPLHAELASRLYAQALRLKTRAPDDTSPLHVVDLTGQTGQSEPTGDELARLLGSINALADAHQKDATAASSQKRSVTSTIDSKELYKKARTLGLNSSDNQVLMQVIHTDLSLASLYCSEGMCDDSFNYLKEAMTLEGKITGDTNVDKKIKALDKDEDGFVCGSELTESLKAAKERLKQLVIDYPDKGAAIK